MAVKTRADSGPRATDRTALGVAFGVAVEFYQYVEALWREGPRFADAAARAPLTRPIPTCPRWRMRDLIQHTGAVHRKVTTYISQARTDELAGDAAEIVGGWPSDAALIDWFLAGHAALVDALRTAPVDLVCFTLLPAHESRLMWSRRQAHETAIHRADASAASGVIPSYPGNFAADGIDELLAEMLARPSRAPSSDTPYSMRVEPTDVDTAWTVSVDPDDYRVIEGAGVADVTVRGSASNLYLYVWNRLDASSLHVTGDVSITDRWRATAQV